MHLEGGGKSNQGIMVELYAWIGSKSDSNGYVGHVNNICRLKRLVKREVAVYRMNEGGHGESK